MAPGCQAVYTIGWLLAGSSRYKFSSAPDAALYAQLPISSTGDRYSLFGEHHGFAIRLVVEKRQRYRLTNEVKILVKVGNKSSQVGSVKNLTRNGIFFEAFGDYQPGMEMEVIFPYDPSKPSMEQPMHAEVVRVQKIKGSLKQGVAIKLLGIFLKP